MQDPAQSDHKNNLTNFVNSKLEVFAKVSPESKLALAVLIFTFLVIWFFNIGEYKTYAYNYSFCLALAGVIGVLQSFFYSFAQITRDLKSKNWFTVGMDTLFNLVQVVFLISGVKELTQRTDPFNTVIFIFYTAVIFFAQIYINKSYRLFKITIIITIILALITSIFRLLETYTPSDYLYLIWALGSYAILACSMVLFFSVIKFSTNSLTKS
jgi:hypothetical protein